MDQSKWHMTVRREPIHVDSVLAVTQTKPDPPTGKPWQRVAIPGVGTANRWVSYDDCPMCGERGTGYAAADDDELFRPGGFVLALIGLVLLVLWLLGFVAFHVTTGVIHILLVLAIISIIVHFLRGRTVA
jgi:hypothetical protein